MIRKRFKLGALKMEPEREVERERERGMERKRIGRGERGDGIC